ncbi:MAG TPA: cytochrome P450 [Vicinamibacterales bacterium]|nr:cytochrome P450 [Vicinamibacterales bacterium]
MATAVRPPGPKAPLLGTLIMPGRNPLSLFSSLTQTYGDITFFKLGAEKVYLLNHPQYIREVLVTQQKNFTKSRGLERAKKLLGEGLLTSEGAAHLRQRRLLQPAFHRDRIADYAQTMVDRAAAMGERWKTGEQFDVSKEMMRLTLAIVGKTLFDKDVESRADVVGKAVTEVLETFWLALLPFSELIDKLPFGKLRRARLARAKLDALIYEMIAERRATGDRGDLLSMLLAVRDDIDDDGPAPTLSDLQIRDEAMTILLAGHETTANALTWTWYLLSQHPAVEAALHEELERVLGGQLPAMADLGRLKFTERLITESMRLYPPAWMIGRRAINDFNVGEYTVPARAMVLMSQYVIQRDARFYPDPERFDPDRWTTQFKEALPKFAYFPFGGGVRQCIGEQFAWMELILVVATLAQQWRLTVVPGHPVVAQPLITLRAKHGVQVTATARR